MKSQWRTALPIFCLASDEPTRACPMAKNHVGIHSNLPIHHPTQPTRYYDVIELSTQWRVGQSSAGVVLTTTTNLLGSL